MDTNKSPRLVALHDIAQWMKENGVDTKKNSSGDIWIVSAFQLDCHKQRRLNIELGLHKVNFKKESMARYKKS